MSTYNKRRRIGHKKPAPSDRRIYDFDAEEQDDDDVEDTGDDSFWMPDPEDAT